jgi:hypothetical protein
VFQILSKNPEGITSKKLLSDVAEVVPMMSRKELIDKIKPIIRSLGKQTTINLNGDKEISVWKLRKNPNTSQIKKKISTYQSEASNVPSNAVIKNQPKKKSTNNPVKLVPNTDSTKTEIIKVDASKKETSQSVDTPKTIEKTKNVSAACTAGSQRIEKIKHEERQGMQSQSDDDDGVIDFVPKSTKHKNSVASESVVEKDNPSNLNTNTPKQTPQKLNTNMPKQTSKSPQKLEKRKRKRSMDEISKKSTKKMRTSKCGCYKCIEFGLKAYTNHLEGIYGPIMKSC